MAAKTAVYFPLRANAHALIAGTPVRSVIPRLKIAALLHDYVIVESGFYIISAGPTGGVSIWNRHDPRIDGAPRWQASRERALAAGKEFYMGMVPTSAPEGTPLQTLLRSETEIQWSPTFEPLKNELPRAYDWMMFGHVDDLQDVKSLVRRLLPIDSADGWVSSRIESEFARKHVVESAWLDILTAASFGAAVALDRLHSTVPDARKRRGEAELLVPAFGHATTGLLFPEVRDLGWDQIDELRRSRGMSELRAVLAEIEAAAWAATNSGRQFEMMIRDEYEHHLVRAANRMNVGISTQLLTTTLGAAAGEVTGQIAGSVPHVGLVAGAIAGGFVGIAAGEVISHHRRPRWLVAHSALRSAG